MKKKATPPKPKRQSAPSTKPKHPFYNMKFDDIVEAARRRAKQTAYIDSLRAADQLYRDTHPGIVKLDYVKNMRATPSAGLAFI